MYNGVIFDLDGTLLNTLDDLRNAGNYMLEQLNMPTFSRERYKYFVGNGLPTLVRRLLCNKCTESVYEKAFSLFTEYYSKNMQVETAPYEGIAELLEKLKVLNVKIGVVTNKEDTLAKEIVINYFGDVFDCIYGLQPSIPAKPDPTITNNMVEAFDLPKNEILFVGDSNVDVETAKNAGLTCCGVLWGFRNRDDLIECNVEKIAKDTDELFDIIVQK